MATNQVFPLGWQLQVACSHPTTPVSGDPVRYLTQTGVALIDEQSDGLTTVNFGPAVWDLVVDDNIGGGIAVGDKLYYHDSGTGTGSVHVNNDPSGGYFFGIAYEVVSANATTLINVFHPESNGGVVPAALDASAVGLSSDANIAGTIPILYRFDIAAGALASKDIVVTQKIRVIDAWLVLRGAGVSTTTLTVLNSASAITNAMAASGSDQALVRATTINDANWEIAAAGTLRVQSLTGASQPDATVFVSAVRVP
jgi:hypothetical protein